MARHETNKEVTVDFGEIPDGHTFSGTYKGKEYDCFVCKCGAALVWCSRCRDLGTFPLRCGNGCSHECGIIGLEKKLLDDISAKTVKDVMAAIPEDFFAGKEEEEEEEKEEGQNQNTEVVEKEEEKEIPVAAITELTKYERYKMSVSKRGSEYRKKLRDAGLCQACGWKASIPIYKNGYCKMHHEKAVIRSNKSHKKWVKDITEDYAVKTGKKPPASLIKTEVVPGKEISAEPFPTYYDDSKIPELVAKEIFHA